MSIFSKLVPGGLALSVLIGACSGQSSGGDPDSATHWLSSCTSDVDCTDQGTCLCGLCTTACGESAACTAGTTATCVASSDVATCLGASTSSICVASCDGGCPTGTECRDALCLPPAPQPPFPIENPTGTCQAVDDGGRPGYHAPAPTDVYLPDCDLTLKREYWRVFATSPSSAYTVPRLDGEPMLRLFCTDPTYPESAIVQRYGLCQSAGTAAAVDLVNDMDPADALHLTHWLHGQLVFRGTDQGVAPWPVPNDVLDACDLHPAMNSPELASVCEQERTNVQNGTDRGISYAPVGLELARLLNELYGIDATDLDVFGVSLCSLAEDPGSCSNPTTQYRYDPASATCVPFTWSGCGGNVNRFETLDLCNQFCGRRRVAGCTPAGACAACPLVLDSSGFACTSEGLGCTFAFGGCSGGMCSCVPDGSGGLVWDCAPNAC